MSKEGKHNMASCMLSILDSLKLYDNNSLELGDETLSEMMFRKMEGYNIDLNKELGFTHLKPVTKTNMMSELDEQLQTLKHKEIVKKAITEVSKETNIADYFVLDKCLMLVLDKLVELKK